MYLKTMRLPILKFFKLSQFISLSLSLRFDCNTKNIRDRRRCRLDTRGCRMYTVRILPRWRAQCSRVVTKTQPFIRFTWSITLTVVVVDNSVTTYTTQRRRRGVTSYARLTGCMAAGQRSRGRAHYVLSLFFFFFLQETEIIFTPRSLACSAAAILYSGCIRRVYMFKIRECSQWV